MKLHLNNPQLQAWGITLLRVVVGIVFFAHGLQKLLGPGIAGVGGMFGNIGIPAPMIAAVLVIVVEALGGLALILGLFTRWAAIPLAFTMLVALFAVHLPHGFFLSSNGYEYVLTLAAATTTLFLVGGGALALDNGIAQWRTRSPAVASARESA